jgi:hypothetical protein
MFETAIQITGLVFAALIFLVLFGVFASLAKLVMQWAGARAEFYKAKFIQADVALAPFGRTEWGKFVHGRVSELYERVDEPNDAAVIWATEKLRLVSKILPNTDDLIDEVTVSQAFSTVTRGALELLDGVPITEKGGAAFDEVRAQGDGTLEAALRRTAEKAGEAGG